MLKYGLSAFIVAVFLIHNTALAQEKGHYEWVESEDGAKTRVFVADDPTLAANILRMKTAAEVKQMSKQGFDELLSLVSAEDMNSISGVELADYQTEQLRKIQSDYRVELRKLDSNDTIGFNTLKLSFGRKIEKLLLPEQLASIANKTSWKNKRVLSLLVYPELAKKIEFTESQRKLLEAECDEANQKVKQAIKEMEEQTEKCRQEIKDIFIRLLTKEQKAAFARNVDIDKLIRDMQLTDMERDTDLEGSRK